MGGLVPLFEPSFKPSSLKEQYGWFLNKFKDYCLFFQIGRFIEFYGIQTKEYAELFRLKIRGEKRGMGKQCGFPIRMLKRYKEMARSACRSYIVIAENGYYGTGLKKRVVTEILTFKEA